MANSKTRLDIGYGYMDIWVIPRFISRCKDITGQHWFGLVLDELWMES